MQLIQLTRKHFFQSIQFRHAVVNDDGSWIHSGPSLNQCQSLFNGLLVFILQNENSNRLQ